MDSPVLRHLRHLKVLVDIVALLGMVGFALAVGGWLSLWWGVGSLLAFVVFTYLRTKQQD